MEEKAESQINKLEEIKKEQVETKKAIIILKEQQKKTNQKLNELKVEQAKTTNSINVTNKLLTEFLNLKRDKLKNHNQNAITILQNSSKQIKNIIEINETPSILKKPEEKSEEISIRSLINNLEISDTSSKKEIIGVKGYKLMKDNKLEISDESAKKKNIGEKGHKLMKNNIFNTNKITKINMHREDNKKSNLLFFNLNIY